MLLFTYEKSIILLFPLITTILSLNLGDNATLGRFGFTGSNLEAIRAENEFLMMDYVNKSKVPRVCSRGCGPIGYCLDRLCYRFPVENIGILMKNRFGGLKKCGDSVNFCDKDGVCVEYDKGRFTCFSGHPICEKIGLSLLSTDHCIDDNSCLSRISGPFLNQTGSVKCQEFDKNNNVCCQVDPKKFKCPDNETILLSQPPCQSDCSETCFRGFCCPNVTRILGETHFGSAPFPTDIPCDNHYQSKPEIPYSGCYNGKLVKFGKNDIEGIRRRPSGRICEISTDGHFFDGCNYDEICILTRPNSYQCIRNPWAKIEATPIELFGFEIPPIYQLFLLIFFFGSWSSMVFCCYQQMKSVR